MSNDRKTVLVTGATGTQGGSVARALQSAGVQTRALVRDPRSAAAAALVDAGITLIAGDLDDGTTLPAALDGVHAVFSVQPASAVDQRERVQARHLLDAARRGGVRQIVHSSVSGTGWRSTHPHVDAGVMALYWDNKEAVEAMVRSSGFQYYTIFKPAFMMENFIGPKSDAMFPDLSAGEMVTAIAQTTEVSLVAADDIGAATVAAVVDPERFNGQEIELSGDAITLTQLAHVINELTGASIAPRAVTADEVNARFGRGSWSPNQLWINDVGYPARPDIAHSHGLITTSFQQWANRHLEALRIATGATAAPA